MSYPRLQAMFHEGDVGVARPARRALARHPSVTHLSLTPRALFTTLFRNLTVPVRLVARLAATFVRIKEPTLDE